MLASSSMINASGERCSPAVAVVSLGVEFIEGADIWVLANDRTKASGLMIDKTVKPVNYRL
jgi:hypothetical protein